MNGKPLLTPFFGQAETRGLACASQGAQDCWTENLNQTLVFAWLEVEKVPPLAHMPQGLLPIHLHQVGSAWEYQVGERGQEVEREVESGGAVALGNGVPVEVGYAVEAEVYVWILQMLVGHWEASAVALEVLCCPSAPRQDQVPSPHHHRCHHLRCLHCCPHWHDPLQTGSGGGQDELILVRLVQRPPSHGSEVWQGAGPRHAPTERLSHEEERELVAPCVLGKRWLSASYFPEFQRLYPLHHDSSLDLLSALPWSSMAGSVRAIAAVKITVRMRKDNLGTQKN